MPALAERITEAFPDLDRVLALEHLRRLDERYQRQFSIEEIASHLRAIARLTSRHPASAIVRRLDRQRFECTVVAFDYPAEFSLITGVLASLGLDIVSGDVFTWRPADDRTPPGLARRRIVDRFLGTATGEDDWGEAVAERLEAVISLAEPGSLEAVTRARGKANELAAESLARLGGAIAPVLYPVRIEVESLPLGRVRMSVVSQDTPFFLFTFSTALSLQGVSIEQVTIRTVGGRIEDTFDLADASGRPLAAPERIDRIKLSVLLTKQFTMFLGQASDPLAAIERFEHLVQEVLDRPGEGRWFELLADQHVLSDLAHLLGASTFLWEDFVRLQYESLLPMLRSQVAGRRFSAPVDTLAERLDAALAEAKTDADFSRLLNEFKDREVFLYDLDHILSPDFDFLELSRRLTALAELVIGRAASCVQKDLSRRFGEPRTVAGLPVACAILGLGKTGGAALGYASDIELLFVYGDSGRTAGGTGESLENAEFFDRLVRGVLAVVRAKREGIFHIDLRLRPYGSAGPLASSLGSFCAYYAPDGPAHAYERLALVRLRAIGGDRPLGERIERLRDEMVYAAARIDLASLRALRERQLAEKTRPGAANAKFSPGALVDLEYAVQILQVEHGRANPRLRTPRIHQALDALTEAGVVDLREAGELIASYHFFRSLINGLRMLRGSAQDLFLPDPQSDEYLHLARRMGYTAEAELGPARSLSLDFQMHTAEVRAFLQRHFGRDALPGPQVANVADLVLSESVPTELARRVLSERGFRDPDRALVNLRGLSGEAEQKSLFARLAVLACETLGRMPDPDMALNNWERFQRSVPDSRLHLANFLAQPMRLEILLSLLATSQFLADSLVRAPSLLDEISAPARLHSPCRVEELARELDERSNAAAERGAWLDALRRVRRRELVLICVRDVFLGVSTRHVTEEISDLAEAIVRASLQRLIRDGLADAGAGGPTGFCVIAFGKLGGRELNYSSDLDLLGLSETSQGVEPAKALMRRLVADLSEHTEEGHAYRIDLRLRPWGSAGELVSTSTALQEYYERSAHLWELQAMLKARPIAGDLAAGERFLEAARRLLARPRGRKEVVASIERMRAQSLRALARHDTDRAAGTEGPDLKCGPGGIRDVEFLTQGLQLLYAHRHPSLASGGTLDALNALGEAGALPLAASEELSEDYLFLRRAEHFLQVYEDRQVHRLPTDPAELRALSRRLFGPGGTRERLLAELEERFMRVRAAFEAFRDGRLGAASAVGGFASLGRPRPGAASARPRD